MTKTDSATDANLRTMLGMLKYPVISDKATRLLELNKYTFMVDKRANKFTIKKIPNDIKNSYQIICAWWDLSSLFSNLKFHDKELLS